MDEIREQLIEFISRTSGMYLHALKGGDVLPIGDDEKSVLLEALNPWHVFGTESEKEPELNVILNLMISGGFENSCYTGFFAENGEVYDSNGNYIAEESEVEAWAHIPEGVAWFG